MGMLFGTITVSWPTACSMASLGQHLVYHGSDHDIPSDDVYNMVVRQTLYHLVDASDMHVER